MIKRDYERLKLRLAPFFIVFFGMPGLCGLQMVAHDNASAPYMLLCLLGRPRKCSVCEWIEKSRVVDNARLLQYIGVAMLMWPNKH